MSRSSMAMPPAPPRPMDALWRRLAAAQDAAIDDAALRASDESPTVVARPRAVTTGEVPVFRAPAVPTARAARRSPARIALAGAAAALSVAAVIALFVGGPGRQAPLSVQVGDARVTAAGEAPSLVANARADLALRFSDGSAVTFRAGASGRLASLSSTGAEVVLEHGSLAAHVVHGTATAWVVRAGQYRVRVTGTRFAVDWRSPKLEVSLYEGAVTVEGGVLGAGVPLQAGRRLTVDSEMVRIDSLTAPRTPPRIEPLGAGRGSEGASAAGARTDIEALRADATGTTVATTDTQRAGSDPARVVALLEQPIANPVGRLGGLDGAGDGATLDAVDRTTDARPPRASHSRAGGKRAHIAHGAGVAADETWLALAEDGQYPEALAAARHLGLSRLYKRLDAHRLLTLADVARYSSARVPARRAFEALARRYPHDRLAADAVFSLGRMAFEAGRPSEAARWFRRYGADWPNGPLGDEAAGRLVESAIRMQDMAAARAAAHAYLARAPEGAQAALARGVLADPTDGTP